MATENQTLAIWRRLSRKPGGKWLFSRLVCFKAPYFGSIRPLFSVLEPHRSVVTMRRRRAVQNHIGTVHAIAMCNLAEIAAGTMTDATVPKDLRWIPKGMTVEYLAKGETDLTATANIDASKPISASSELPVLVDVTDEHENTVFRAEITMWVTAKQRASA